MSLENQDLIDNLNKKLIDNELLLTYEEYVNKIKDEFCENINNELDINDQFEFPDNNIEIHYSHPNLADLYKKNYNEYKMSFLLQEVKDLKEATEFYIKENSRLEYKIEHLEDENDVEKERINNLEAIINTLNHKINYQLNQLQNLEKYLYLSIPVIVIISHYI